MNPIGRVGVLATIAVVLWLLAANTHTTGGSSEVPQRVAPTPPVVSCIGPGAWRLNACQH